MYEKIMAMILASGMGKRMGSSVAKQYLLLDGIPVLVHSLRPFQASNRIRGIILALPQNDIISVRRDLIEQYGITKIVAVVPGGKERQDSVRNCLKNVDEDCDLVVIHDAARPFVSVELINQVIKAAQKSGAAIPGIRVQDTIKETNAALTVLKTVPRDHLWLTQTPQAFHLRVLREAYQAADAENFYGTDDASLVERIKKNVTMIEGSSSNIKITTREDLLIADTLMKKREIKNIRTGIGYDSHRLVKGRKLILGGVEIPFAKGLKGHSDADVVVHAVCDAILGAASCGDIGRHFSDKDQKYQDISSLLLLDRVKKIVKTKGYVASHVDVTVIMEEPRVAPYAKKMIANICRVLELPENGINMKAKTNEGMGFVGRGEGIAAWAVATVEGKI